jgi:hypothetical protein
MSGLVLSVSLGKYCDLSTNFGIKREDPKIQIAKSKRA